eukprot:Seg1647.11 transcript_id=Seg1647.11/GoldUCD/mRNA.D3Y31 product=tRNA-dihydrouridine protein_id=Seg1647.11/GoldUCD/D3Y31
MPSKYSGYEFYEKVLGSPKRILAPMVDQSELAWRMLSRKYGADLCYTPMWHAGVFVRDGNYRNDALESCPDDRPLIVQFCSNDPQTFMEAALLAEPHCDAVDLNLGCPQIIARRGHYGSFLQDEWDLLHNMVSLANEKLSIPVTCKIRVFEDIGKTVEYAKMLEKAGAKIITVHGRTRECRGPPTGLASWDHIKAVKENVSVPVFANGNIQYGSDIDRCIAYTGVDGVMCAEGSLTNPAIFMNLSPPAWEISEEYLQFAEKYSPPLTVPRASRCPHLSFIRGHLFKIWRHVLAKFQDYRYELGIVKTFEDMRRICEELKLLCLKDAEKDTAEGKDSVEPGKIPYWRCQPYVRPPPKPDQIRKKKGENTKDGCKTNEDSCNKDKIKRIPSGKAITRQERKIKCIKENKATKYLICIICNGNPKGLKCSHSLCRKCCRTKTSTEILDCASHSFRFKTRQDQIKKKQNAEIRTENEQQQQQPNALELQQPQSELIEAPTENIQMQRDEKIDRAEITESTT